MQVKYDNFKTESILPSEVAPVLALLRRSLPPSYRKLFDYLHVATLPPLPENQAGLYKKCEMHDEWMMVADIPISYGLPRFDENYMKAEKQLFPNANLRRLGGCVVSENSPRTTKGLYCESCRKAEAEWREKQKEQMPSN